MYSIFADATACAVFKLTTGYDGIAAYRHTQVIVLAWNGRCFESEHSFG
jgi:hypothetical protein